jgi:hypothetical protein
MNFLLQHKIDELNSQQSHLQNAAEQKSVNMLRLETLLKASYEELQQVKLLNNILLQEKERLMSDLKKYNKTIASNYIDARLMEGKCISAIAGFVNQKVQEVF